MALKTSKQTIQTILTRGVDTVYPSTEKLQALLQKKQLRVYHGIDPTGSTLHLGHTIPLRKLRQFQERGHKTILLIGTFTAQIGDPTGKDKTRTPLSKEQIESHTATYKEQLSKILDFDNPENPTEIAYNSTWLEKLTFQEIIKLASTFTVQQMLERDMFQQRMEKNKPIGLHEFLYPLMQGYDTVALDADIEIGGTDQTFNMLAGRTLMKTLKKKEKFVITTPLLEDAKGKKIGKTEGNIIGITDTPNDLFGEVMALSDEAIIPTMKLATDIEESEISTIEQDIENGGNPKDAKERLAQEIVTMYHSKKDAQSAQQEFQKIFARKELPSDIQEVTRTSIQGENIADIIAELKLTKSKSDAKRLIEQGAVKINKKKIEAWDIPLPKEDVIIQVGKRKFIKVIAA